MDLYALNSTGQLPCSSFYQLTKSKKENPQKLTQLSSRSHPRHLVGNRTAQKDTIIDITSDSQVNSNFPYRWSPASLFREFQSGPPYLFSLELEASGNVSVRNIVYSGHSPFSYHMLAPRTILLPLIVGVLQFFPLFSSLSVSYKSPGFSANSTAQNTHKINNKKKTNAMYRFGVMSYHVCL